MFTGVMSWSGHRSGWGGAPEARRARRVRTVVAVTFAVAALLAPGSSLARAATIGNFTFAPASGDGTTVMNLVSSGPCLHGSEFQVFVTGSGLPAAGVAVTDSTPVSALTLDSGGGYDVTVLSSMDSIAAAQSPAATLSGDYTFTGRCTDAPGGPALDSYVGTVTFTANAGASATYVAKVQVQFGYFTVTALAASPGGPVTAGTAVTFTAHVSSSPVGGAIGTVQLKDGGSNLGASATVDTSGNATITVPLTNSGDNSITAAFTGKAAFITDSVSPPLVITVNGVPADATTTALSLSPAAAATSDTVTFTATVADTPHPTTAPHGTVQFTDHGTPLGSPVAIDSAGRATYAHTLSAGDHSLAASFVPTDPAAFRPSVSAGEPYTVTQAAGTSQDIQTTVDPGALTISVADTTTVVLPSPLLNATATFLTTSGQLHPVTVTDTRAGSPGWVLSGQVSDFTNSGSAATTPISGSNLGWSPAVLDHSAGQVIVAGHQVDPAQPPVLTDLAASDPRGLSTSRQLATAAAGQGTGTAHLSAQVTLNVPTSVQAGTYEATLTLTAI